MAGPILPAVTHLTGYHAAMHHLTAEIASGGHGWGYAWIFDRPVDTLLAQHDTDHEIWTNSPSIAHIYNDMLPEGFHTHEKNRETP